MPGAVAAPTAGLHFNAELLASLSAQGIGFGRLTLHVGAGTFAPLRPQHLKTGRPHAERLSVSAELCAAVAECRARGGRVVAVGTTAVRGLETAAAGGVLRPFDGETSLFLVDPKAEGVTITPHMRIDGLPCADIKLSSCPAACETCPAIASAVWRQS